MAMVRVCIAEYFTYATVPSGLLHVLAILCAGLCAGLASPFRGLAARTLAWCLAHGEYLIPA